MRKFSYELHDDANEASSRKKRVAFSDNEGAQCFNLSQHATPSARGSDVKKDGAHSEQADRFDDCRDKMNSLLTALELR